MKFKKLPYLILFFSSVFLPKTYAEEAVSDIPGGFTLKPEWSVGIEAEADYIIPTDGFYTGSNEREETIRFGLGSTLRGGFRFNPETREGMLYKGLYQGAALGIKTFFHKALMGNPGMFYVFQGAPLHHFGKKFHLGYEWNFGIAFGWHHAPMPWWDPNAFPISTAVTAHMGVALKLNYDLTSHWMLSMALRGVHHSNGNTSWRNAGMNAAGLSVGVSYIINPMQEPAAPPDYLIKEADAKKWFYDLMIFGAWRRRVVYLPDSPFLDELDRNDALAPKKYPVFGMQFAPAITLNRWVAVGPALDIQWDKSCDLARHWIEQPIDEAIEFTPVPFKDQVSVGVSAHAELTTPIFAINAGVGLNVINPKGDQRFYQSLAVKAFLSSHFYLNIGYRLGSFKTPQHLMLGAGYRFRRFRLVGKFKNVFSFKVN